jgi:hypothetical protein
MKHPFNDYPANGNMPPIVKPSGQPASVPRLPEQREKAMDVHRPACPKKGG